MKVLRFTGECGRFVDRFGSNFVMSRIIEHHGDVHIACMHLNANGRIGHHDATTGQLFFVVEGEGWVRGKKGERLLIQAGEAAFWRKGEGHESGTETGMTAIVIESD
ncbi:MAG TPA: cupin [Bacillales bacterium]